MSVEFWIGSFLAIPIGVITSLLTPWIVRKVNNWTQVNRQKNIEYERKEYERICNFYKNKQDLSVYYLNVVVKTTFLSAFMAIFSSLLYFGGQMMQTILTTRLSLDINMDQRHISILFGLGQFINLFGSVMIVTICKPALNVWGKIRNFQEYEEDLKSRKIIPENNE